MSCATQGCAVNQSLACAALCMGCTFPQAFSHCCQLLFTAGHAPHCATGQWQYYTVFRDGLDPRFSSTRTAGQLPDLERRLRTLQPQQVSTGRSSSPMLAKLPRGWGETVRLEETDAEVGLELLEDE